MAKLKRPKGLGGDTRRVFSFIYSAHNKLVARYPWYSRWHQKIYASKVHYGALGLVLIIVSTITALAAIQLVNLPVNNTKVQAAASTCTAKASTAWALATTWTQTAGAGCTVAGGPVAGDIVIIPSGFTVTVGANAAAASIEIKSPAAATGLTIGAGFDLTLTGDLKFDAPGAAFAQTVTLTTPGTLHAGSVTMQTATIAGASSIITFTGASTVTITGAVTMATGANTGLQTISVGTGTLIVGSASITGGSSTGVAKITVGGGIFTANGNVSFFGASLRAQLVTTVIAQINLNTSVIGTGGSLTLIAGTKLTTTSTSAVNLPSANWGLITVTSGALTMGAAVTTTGITITAGSFTLGGDLTLNGNLITGNGTTYSGAFTTTVSGAARTLGTVAATGVTITFNALTFAASATATANLGFTVTNAMTFTSTTAAAQSLTIGGAYTVSVGSIAMNQPGALYTSAFNINTGLVTVTGSINLAGATSTATWVSTVVVTTGTLTVNGSITYTGAITTPASKVVTVGAGTITIVSLETIATGTLKVTSTGTIDLQAGMTLTTSATAATFTQFSGATVKLGGPFISNTTAYIFTVGSKVEFDDAGSNTVTSNTAITFANVQIDSGATVTLAVAGFTVAGSWTNNYAGSGIGGLSGNFVITFSGASKTIGGTSGTNFYGLAISTGATIQLNTSSTVGAGNFVIGGATGGTATSFTHNTGISLTITGAATVNQPTTAAVIYAWNINTGSAVVTGTVTLAGTTATANYINKIVLTTGTLEMNAATSLTIGAAIVANHIIDTSGGASFVKIAGTNTNAANATSVPGTTSTWVFDGTAAGQSIPVAWGTAAAYANIQILNTNAAGAYPAGAITATNVTGHITVGDDSNTAAIFKNGSVNIADNGTSIFTVKNGATFQMDGTTAVFPTSFATFTFGATSTTIYNQTSAQNIYNIASPGYGNLSLTPAGTVSYTGQTGSLLVQGNLIVGNGTNILTFTNVTSDPTINVNGNTTVAAAAILIASDLNPMLLAGNWLNSGALTSTGSTVTLDGVAAQSVTCGSSSFNNLIITNASASGTSFVNGCTVTGTFTDTTASSKITFHSTSTYAFNAISINGSAIGTRVVLTSSTGASPWNLNITAASPVASYVDVKDSNANKDINATSGGFDSTGNTHWLFPSSNSAPTNDSLTFTNPYSINAAIADDTTVWDFQAKVTDADGPTNLNYVELRFANSADSAQPYDSLKFRWTEATDTFSETADTQGSTTLISTSADSNAVGNQWTLNFKIKFNSSFTTASTNYATELYTIDDAAASDTDNYANIYQVNALSLSLGVDSGTLSFGSLLPGSVITGTTITTVTTNYPNGYSLSASDGVAGSDSALLHTDTTTRIADYAGTIASPTLWSGNGLGICVFLATGKNTTQWGAGTTVTDSLNKYAGVPQNATVIHSKTLSPTTNDQTSIGYKLVVPNTQKTGDYSGIITYTATGVLN